MILTIIAATITCSTILTFAIARALHKLDNTPITPTDQHVRLIRAVYDQEKSQ